MGREDRPTDLQDQAVGGIVHLYISKKTLSPADHILGGEP